jgi:hypothetical protein
MNKIPEDEDEDSNVWVIDSDELSEPLILIIGEHGEETSGYGIPPKSEMH